MRFTSGLVAYLVLCAAFAIAIFVRKSRRTAASARAGPEQWSAIEAAPSKQEHTVEGDSSAVAVEQSIEVSEESAQLLSGKEQNQRRSEFVNAAVGEETVLEQPVYESGFKTTDETQEPVVQKTDLAPTSSLHVRVPRQYQPRIGATVALPRERGRASATQSPQERALGLIVRVLFERGGWCTVSLIPERRPSMPDVVEASGNVGSCQFAALQEDFYQDVIPENIGSCLRIGIELEQKAKRGGVRWSLSGRQVFVLAQSNKLRGFVSVPRLLISDEEQLVLCTKEYRPATEQVLEEIGCAPCTTLDKSTGVPEGWILFRGVRPKCALPLSPDDSILNALRPQPDIEIILEGGIRVQHSDWLAGFPPRIRVRGDFDAALLIDGRQAEKESDGVFVSHEWDRPGRHVVACVGVSRSYSIVQPEEQWQPWSAYCFPIGSSSKGLPICGAATLDASSCAGQHVLWIPGSNPVLLGANPGEVLWCQHRTDVTTGRWPVSVPFDVVWAVPADPLHGDKRATHVLLLGEPKHPPTVPRNIRANATERKRLLAWASEILSSRRKGLSIQPATSETEELWHAYCRTAKTIWKALR